MGSEAGERRRNSENSVWGGEVRHLVFPVPTCGCEILKANFRISTHKEASLAAWLEWTSPLNPLSSHHQPAVDRWETHEVRRL